MVPQDWQERSKCLNEPVDNYDVEVLAERYGPKKARTVAKKLCEGCPVMVQCTEWAITTGATGVVRGGVPLPMSVHSNSRFDRLFFLLQKGRPPEEGEIMVWRDSPDYQQYGELDPSWTMQHFLESTRSTKELEEAA